MRKAIAVILSTVFVFLPVISNAEMPEVFTNPEMKDKVKIENLFKKDYSGDEIIGHMTRVLHVQQDGDGEKQFIIRVAEQGYNQQEDFYWQKDSTLFCGNLDDINTCKVVSANSVCKKDEKTGEFSKCYTNGDTYKGKKIPVAQYATDLKDSIKKTFLNPSKRGYKVACRSVVDRKDIESKGMESLLETKIKGPSIFQTIASVTLGLVAIATQTVGVNVGPAVTSVTNAAINVGIGAAAEATSTIVGGISIKIMDDSDPVQNQTIPKCVIQKPENKTHGN
jgi:hypothetical protein